MYKFYKEKSQRATSLKNKNQHAKISTIKNQHATKTTDKISLRGEKSLYKFHKEKKQCVTSFTKIKHATIFKFHRKNQFQNQ